MPRRTRCCPKSCFRLVVVPPGEEGAFLAPLPIEKLWGVGEVAARRLHDLGLHTIGDLAAVPLKSLIYAFGNQGATLHDYLALVPDDVIDLGKIT